IKIMSCHACGIHTQYPKLFSNGAADIPSNREPTQVVTTIEFDCMSDNCARAIDRFRVIICVVRAITANRRQFNPRRPTRIPLDATHPHLLAPLELVGPSDRNTAFTHLGDELQLESVPAC